MTVASLVLGAVGILLAILPLVYTQLLAVLVGVAALVLGLWGRSQAREQQRSVLVPTIAAAVAAVAILLGGLLYGLFLYGGERVGEAAMRQAKSRVEAEEGRVERSFRQAVKQAIDASRAADKKGAKAPKPAPGAKPDTP